MAADVLCVIGLTDVVKIMKKQLKVRVKLNPYEIKQYFILT